MVVVAKILLLYCYLDISHHSISDNVHFFGHQSAGNNIHSFENTKVIEGSSKCVKLTKCNIENIGEFLSLIHI